MHAESKSEFSPFNYLLEERNLISNFFLPYFQWVEFICFMLSWVCIFLIPVFVFVCIMRRREGGEALVVVWSSRAAVCLATREQGSSRRFRAPAEAEARGIQDSLVDRTRSVNVKGVDEWNREEWKRGAEVGEWSGHTKNRNKILQTYMCGT